MPRATFACAALFAALAAGAISAGEGPERERTLAYAESGRTYGYAHYYKAYEKAEGAARLTVREVRSRFLLLTLGAEVDLAVDHIYVMPSGSRRALGFAVRQKTKEVDQFTEGALTPAGLMCRVTRNGEVVLKQTVKVPLQTVIPVDMSFVPRLVRRAGGKGGTAAVLSVESLSLVQMKITPAGTAKISVAGREREAARYNVVAGSEGTPQALRTRHALYFDPGTDELLLSVEDDPSSKRRKRVELSGPGAENSLRRLRQRGEVPRAKRLPWAPGEKATYAVRRDGVKAGSVEIRLEKAGDKAFRLVSERRLGADIESAEAVLTPEGYPVSYDLKGTARLISATGEPVEKAYSARCSFGAARIDRLYAAGEARSEGSRPLDGKVYLLDRNAPGLFAVVASQLDLELGKSATLGIYHARDGEAALLTFTAVSSGEGPRGPYYVVHVRGRTWMGRMTVAADGTLLRADRLVGGVATLEYLLER